MKYLFPHAFVPVLCVAGMTFFSACSNSDSDPVAPIICPLDTTGAITPTHTAQHYPSAVNVDGRFTLTNEQQYAIDKNNAFALKLLNHIHQSEKSTVFSPLSLTMALAFAADGASGTTRDEIWNTIGFKELVKGIKGEKTDNAMTRVWTDDDMKASVNELCATIMQNTLQADTATRFNIANAFYLNATHGFTLKDTYISRLHDYYDADIETLDFGLRSSLDHINAWGSRQTNGMIPAVLQELNPDVVAYLLNAIFMEGRWQKQFQADDTQDGNFTNSSGNVTTVPLMHQTSYFPYEETDTYQAVRMEYGNGTFGMSIILPKEGHNIEKLLATLTPDDLRSIAGFDQAIAYVRITLPRFTTDIRTDLKDILSSMGILEAFDPQHARFDDVVNETSLFIDEIFQKARIEVAEKGTLAAAITVIGVAATSLGDFEEPQTSFTANHPFLYFITERRTGTIYFMGIYDGR